MTPMPEHPVPRYYDGLGGLQRSEWKCPSCGCIVVASTKTKGVPLILCAECASKKARA